MVHLHCLKPTPIPIKMGIYISLMETLPNIITEPNSIGIGISLGLDALSVSVNTPLEGIRSVCSQNNFVKCSLIPNEIKKRTNAV